jgi:hypothetical protein
MTGPLISASILLGADTILYGDDSTFAIRALRCCCHGNCLATVERVHLRCAVGENGLNEIVHLVEVSIGESN